jgi:hypothetical protein
MANTSDRPISFTLEDVWEQVDAGEAVPFNEEPMRLGHGASGRVSGHDLDVLEVGSLQPGESTWTTVIVTSQEPGMPDGYTKVVATQQGTGLRHAHIIAW